MTAAGTTRVCHNLDYATSGVVACAKSEGAAREVRKLYAALVFGHPAWEERNISARIAVTARKFRQSVTKASWGKARQCGHDDGDRRCARKARKEASLLWLTPLTGRRHQLRLHMAHIGHPIVGDVTYGADRRSYRIPAFWPGAVGELLGSGSQGALKGIRAADR
ncbi:hypothetical protein EMIHUDRAFT_211996 [Emiliania huxleyi CCMP1516]|uniref:Pseudouridine synthase RsuA/RluA-like domain-containing protein n=2 Tax=Emiliania huxleyi TaxID=2903 RepID=A0A0D3IS13_EMIH1|nr:hypothetical protein EMIHUDRAFT_211996 [Emiliania huxleyi CCMP1516]EOD14048.1 hypothetical protein EMIHUDRAFT_211996 [Emiliania huxleyi CCMP1516]|eukprot:XP_005766477.1 hypothetical protein EMIHUDRAFT_211996 [Emiliania huxleyi CCMP1516]